MTDYRTMKAKQLLEDEVLIAAFDALEAKAMREALAVPAWHGKFGDRKRRVLLLKVNIINELRGELKSVMMTGQQAARPQSGVA